MSELDDRMNSQMTIEVAPVTRREEGAWNRYLTHLVRKAIFLGLLALLGFGALSIFKLLPALVAVVPAVKGATVFIAIAFVTMAGAYMGLAPLFDAGKELVRSVDRVGMRALSIVVAGLTEWTGLRVVAPVSYFAMVIVAFGTALFFGWFVLRWDKDGLRGEGSPRRFAQKLLGSGNGGLRGAGANGRRNTCALTAENAHFKAVVVVFATSAIGSMCAHFSRRRFTSYCWRRAAPRGARIGPSLWLNSVQDNGSIGDLDATQG